VATRKLHLLARVGKRAGAPANGRKANISEARIRSRRSVGRKTRRAERVVLVLGVRAPVLSRSVRVALPKMVRIERSVRPYSPHMVRQGSRLKTGADYPCMKQYVRRAEFFALPRRRSRCVALSPVRPFALSPLYGFSTSNAFLTLFGRRIRRPRFALGDPLR
jgi:hypothetical protein